MKPARTTVTVPGITPIAALENTVLSIRGTVIHYFVRIEMMMDTIIIKTLFDKEETYLKYMEILVPNGNINMKIKLKMFGLCLEKYQNKNGGNFSEFMEKLKA
ncbi:MAG TPA: hypothetical protein VK705_05430, partial [Ferruginibacter sp.]|nr:hypothetical protein [Ferruginibacter sp.]